MKFPGPPGWAKWDVMKDVTTARRVQDGALAALEEVRLPKLVVVSPNQHSSTGILFIKVNSLQWREVGEAAIELENGAPGRFIIRFYKWHREWPKIYRQLKVLLKRMDASEFGMVAFPIRLREG